MTDQTMDAPPAAFAPMLRAVEARTLKPTAAFWFSMLAASALGANVGDFCAQNLGLGLVDSFATLAAICILLIRADYEAGARTDVFYWLAIVFLRAVATNVGDFLTHSLGVDYALATALVGVGALAAGYFTRPAPGGASPFIDLRYWGAMGLGGVFGTTGGDLASHHLGLFAATVMLGIVLLATIRARSLAVPSAIVGYWCIVLAERAAGTPLGDWISKGRGLDLGLPVSMIITAGLLLLGLAAGRPNTGPAKGFGTAMIIILPVARLVLLALSVIGCYFMLQIYVVQNPRDPAFVLSYAAGLGLNALYLGCQELASLPTSRAVRLVSLWFAAKCHDFDRWADAKEAELRRHKEALPSSPAPSASISPPSGELSP